MQCGGRRAAFARGHSSRAGLRRATDQEDQQVSWVRAETGAGIAPCAVRGARIDARGKQPGMQERMGRMTTSIARTRKQRWSALRIEVTVPAPGNVWRRRPVARAKVQ